MTTQGQKIVNTLTRHTIVMTAAAGCLWLAVGNHVAKAPAADADAPLLAEYFWPNEADEVTEDSAAEAQSTAQVAANVVDTTHAGTAAGTIRVSA